MKCNKIHIYLKLLKYCYSPSIFYYSIHLKLKFTLPFVEGNASRNTNCFLFSREFDSFFLMETRLSHNLFINFQHVTKSELYSGEASITAPKIKGLFAIISIVTAGYLAYFGMLPAPCLLIIQINKLTYSACLESQCN